MPFYFPSRGLSEAFRHQLSLSTSGTVDLGPRAPTISSDTVTAAMAMASKKTKSHSSAQAQGGKGTLLPDTPPIPSSRPCTTTSSSPERSGETSMTSSCLLTTSTSISSDFDGPDRNDVRLSSASSSPQFTRATSFATLPSWPPSPLATTEEQRKHNPSVDRLAATAAVVTRKRTGSTKTKTSSLGGAQIPSPPLQEKQEATSDDNDEQDDSDGESDVSSTYEGIVPNEDYVGKIDCVTYNKIAEERDQRLRLASERDRVSEQGDAALGDATSWSSCAKSVLARQHETTTLSHERDSDGVETTPQHQHTTPSHERDSHGAETYKAESLCRTRQNVPAAVFNNNGNDRCPRSHVQVTDTAQLEQFDSPATPTSSANTPHDILPTPSTHPAPGQGGLRDHPSYPSTSRPYCALAKARETGENLSVIIKRRYATFRHGPKPKVITTERVLVAPRPRKDLLQLKFTPKKREEAGEWFKNEFGWDWEEY